MSERSLAVRAAWFLLVGWWATPVLVNVAWFFNTTIVGLPLGIALINEVPRVLTLAEPRDLEDDEADERRQPAFVVRAVYFVLVGWWFSFLWANVAAFLAATIFGLPVALWMFNRLPYVTSLYRFHG